MKFISSQMINSLSPLQAQLGDKLLINIGSHFLKRKEKKNFFFLLSTEIEWIVQKAMDALLSKLGAQTANFVIRSGIALTSKYAVQQCSRLLKTVDDKTVYAELKELQRLLNTRIKVHLLVSYSSMALC